MAKTNYHQLRRQKELARKTRQQEKHQKRAAAKVAEPDGGDPHGAVEGQTTAAEASSDGTSGS